MKKQTVAAGCIAGLMAACGGDSVGPVDEPDTLDTSVHAGSGGANVAGRTASGGSTAHAGAGSGGAVIAPNAGRGGSTGGTGGTAADFSLNGGTGGAAGHDGSAGTSAAGVGGSAGVNAGSGGVGPIAGAGGAGGDSGNSEPATRWECVISQGQFTGHHFACDNIYYFPVTLSFMVGDTTYPCPSAAAYPCPDNTACLARHTNGSVSTGACQNVPVE